MVDGAAEHQAERPEPDLAYQQELVDRQVGREDRPGPAGLKLREAAHGILRHARGIEFRRYVALLGHRLSYQIRILAAWRRCGPSDMTASAGPVGRCSACENLAIARPILGASTSGSRRPSCTRHSRSRTPTS